MCDLCVFAQACNTLSENDIEFSKLKAKESPSGANDPPLLDTSLTLLEV